MQKIFKNINLIVACQKDGGIGYKGKIPWRSPSDLSHFKITTSKSSCNIKQNAVVMGRKTFESIGKPLPGRLNYVVTRNTTFINSPAHRLYYNNSLKAALVAATNNPHVDKVFVIGGAEIYNQTLKNWNTYIDKTYLTEIDSKFPCDQFLNLNAINKYHYPDTIGENIIEDNGLSITIKKLHTKNFGEDNYLNLIRKIIEQGTIRENRTGIKTYSLFGEKLEFDISRSIPFMTTKKLAWKTMLRELLWFISGDTNNKTLQEQNVHIWDGNSTREYLDSLGLTDRLEGDLGPVYGFQWRHFGANYINCNTNYDGKGIDQLTEVVRLIKNEPTSRRIILSAWNPQAQPQMALPPCHVMAQWYVRDGQYLDCQLYQRSCDVALGVPFNIASYSVLTYALAHICDLSPGKYIQILGDAHIYENHVPAVKEQLERTPYHFPQLTFARKIKNIDDFKESDFILENYKSHPPIKMDMAI